MTEIERRILQNQAEIMDGLRFIMLELGNRDPNKLIRDELEENLRLAVADTMQQLKEV